MKKLAPLMLAILMIFSIGGQMQASASTITMFKEPPFEAYKVSKGDSFWFIAKRYGLDYKKLMELNPSVDPMNMQIGSTIRLKPKANNSTSTNTSNSVSVGSMSVSAYESQVVNLVNAERSKQGLRPLSLDSELSRVARFKSQDMIDRRYFSHTSPTYGSPFTMMKNFGIKYRSAGENIVGGQRSPQEVVNSWMNSSGHRANILSRDYTHIGVGYAKGGSYGHYWTQMFISK